MLTPKQCTKTEFSALFSPNISKYSNYSLKVFCLSGGTTHRECLPSVKYVEYCRNFEIMNTNIAPSAKLHIQEKCEKENMYTLGCKAMLKNLHQKIL